MGTDFAAKNGACLNNCAFVSTKNIKHDFAEPFCWLMEMLMLGVGVGFDTKGAGLLKVQQPHVGKYTHVVADSREGWVDLLRVVMNSYAGKGSIPENIDYSQVRPEGAPIKGFGGTASGPGPLQELIEEVKKELDALVGQTITTECIVDISNLIGRCVVAGNVRRSAQIAFGDPHDNTFLNLKNPELHKDKVYHHRWASNNSIFADIGMDYDTVADLTALNGEPGYQWMENAQAFSRMGREPDYKDRRVAGSNPCVEQPLEDFEMCNLVETFPSRHENIQDYKKTIKFAYLYAKSVTLVPTHSERTNQVMMRNRRIGCSMSGIVQAMKKHGRREFFNWCDEVYTYLEDLDEVYSDWLCVPKSIKRTTVKPSGTVSLLPGVTPGIHFPHSQYYIRRVRFQENSPMVQTLRDNGYPIEKDAYSPNTVVVSFPVQEAFFDRSKNDVTMWEQLELAAQMQHYWSDNQVSVTITFKKEEAKDIKYALELYETRLKGVSFLPLSDHGYEQAPYEEIDVVKYYDMVSKITTFTAENAQNEVQEKFCSNDSCNI